MSGHAKLFKYGGGQAVQLPRDCQFPEDQSEVVVRKVGQCVVLEGLDEWPDDFVRIIGAYRREIARPSEQPGTPARDALRKSTCTD